MYIESVYTTCILYAIIVLNTLHTYHVVNSNIIVINYYNIYNVRCLTLIV